MKNADFYLIFHCTWVNMNFLPFSAFIRARMPSINENGQITSNQKL
jgi:hypothetical protein